ncbi:MAG: tetratricopeptide repeat protein [Armatimonadetes bacterium]|nr:tetratricopeptide repeat protein [Armatimonadota bacterium]
MNHKALNMNRSRCAQGSRLRGPIHLKDVLLWLALVFFLFSLSSYPASAQNLSPLDEGLKAYYQKRWDESANSFQRAMEQNPKDTLAILYYLVANAQRGMLAKIIDKLEEESALKGTDPYVSARLAFAYYAKGRWNTSILEQAASEFRQALRKQEIGPAYTGLGIISLDRMMLSRAKREFMKALELNPGDAVAAEFLGTIYLQDEKKPDEALPLFQKVSQASPLYPDGFYFMGRAYQDLGKTDDAVDLFKKTVFLDPLGIGKGYYASERLGDIYMNRQLFGEAVSAYKYSLQINPEDTGIKKKLADAEKASKKR